MEAEKSEPPRPSVVGRPSAVAPLKPVTDRHRAAFEQRQQEPRGLAAAWRPSAGSVAEHGVGHNHLRRVHRVAPAFRPLSRGSLTSSAESRSPIATASSTERGGRSPSISMPPTIRSKLCDQLDQRRIASRRPRIRPQPPDVFRARVRDVDLRRPAWSPRLGVLHGVEQQVGDLRHRRDHDDHRPLAACCSRTRRAATRIRSAEPTLVPPNFITSRPLNGRSFPLVMRARTSFKNRFLTSSMDRSVESR